MNIRALHRGSGSEGTAVAFAVGSLAVLIASAAFAVSAPASEDMRHGPALPLGGGTAHAWVSVDGDGQVREIGVSISEAALEGIEALQEAELTLPLPAEAAASGFDHVYLNWSLEGHPPAQVWDTPHFDVHFYMMSPAEREAISPDDPHFAEKAARHPELSFLPVDYILQPDVIPAMGLHWADQTTPELNGEPFTHTLIYGSWDGKVRFVEPMIDLAVFQARETHTAPVQQPDHFAAPVLFPSSYRIDFDEAAREHRVVLDNLVARD